MEAVGPDEFASIAGAQSPDVQESEPTTADEHKFGLPFILNVPIRRTRQSALTKTVVVVSPSAPIPRDAKQTLELSKEEKKRRRTCKHEGCHNYIVHKGLCCRHGVRSRPFLLLFRGFSSTFNGLLVVVAVESGWELTSSVGTVLVLPCLYIADRFRAAKSARWKDATRPQSTEDCAGNMVLNLEQVVRIDGHVSIIACLPLCLLVGGSEACKKDGCDKKAKARGLCWAHGGGTKCRTVECSKVAVSNGFCWAHGGGKRCDVNGCIKPAYERTLNLCEKHFVHLRHANYFEVCVSTFLIC
ncbi:hypothetical protein GQ600_16434 [Phytophthora cactorum]|nr:hypothetical protein GQ600_16434 [Phytophthora cactorum]